MASPQCENGHVRIADELFEAVLRADFSKRELLVVLAVIRKTYGWSKAMDQISSSQLAELTGIAPQHCRAAIRELKARHVIRQTDNQIGIQKDYELWGGPKQAGPKRAGPKRAGPKQAGKAAQNGPERRPKTGHTIDNIQTIDNDPSPLPPPFGEREGQAEAATIDADPPPLETTATLPGFEEPAAETAHASGSLNGSKPAPRVPWTPPAWINRDAWEEFEQHRKEIGKPLTDLARTKAANQLGELSPDEQQQCIDRSIQARWAGLFPEKVKPHAKNQQPYRDRPESRTERNARIQREAEQRAARWFDSNRMG
jgi:phage replication O-like protein O